MQVQSIALCRTQAFLARVSDHNHANVCVHVRVICGKLVYLHPHPILNFPVGTQLIQCLNNFIIILQEFTIMEGSNVVSTYMFRGIEYVVSMNVQQLCLTVEVEDRVTADQWRGSFDGACKFLLNNS